MALACVRRRGRCPKAKTQLPPDRAGDRMKPRRAAGQAHRLDSPSALFVRICHAIRICRSTVTGNFRVDLSTAFFSMFQFFKYQHRGAFGKHEAISIFIKWSGSSFGIVIIQRKSGEQIKSRHTQRMYHGMCSAGDHHIIVAVSNQFKSFSDGLT